jgi:prophage antirepressor-like protein
LREKCKKSDGKGPIRKINLYYRVRFHHIYLFTCWVTVVVVPSVGIRSEYSLTGFVFHACLSERNAFEKEIKKEKKEEKEKGKEEKRKKSKREIIIKKEKEKYGNIEIEKVKM